MKIINKDIREDPKAGLFGDFQAERDAESELAGNRPERKELQVAISGFSVMDPEYQERMILFENPRGRPVNTDAEFQIQKCRWQ